MTKIFSYFDILRLVFMGRKIEIHTSTKIHALNINKCYEIYTQINILLLFIIQLAVWWLRILPILFMGLLKDD